MAKQDLELAVEEMRALGEQLIPFNEPTNESDIYILKTREMTIEGYDVFVYYTKLKYENFATEILQIYGKRMPFLPFYLICKLAKMFLGTANLNLVEIYRGNRKIYCWTVHVDLDGRPIASPYDEEVENCVYEGLQYSYLQPNQVNFY